MSSTITNGQSYYILNLKTLTALNVLSYGPPGTAVVGAVTNWNNQPANSVWTAEAQTNGSWKFYSSFQNSKNYMWFESGVAYTTNLTTSVANHDPKQTWTCNLQNKRPSVPAYFSIQNYDTGLFIDLKEGNPGNGTPVVAQNQSPPAVSNQYWVFVPTVPNA